MSRTPAQTPDHVTIGIDISKDRLDLHLHPQGITKQFSNAGFAAATAFARLIDLPGRGSMDSKQAASQAGLAPVTRPSGNWRGKSFIQGGRATLRQALYIPALVAIRFNPPLKAKYRALRQAGKPAKVALVATLQKLVIIANALLRNNREWTLETA